MACGCQKNSKVGAIKKGSLTDAGMTAFFLALGLFGSKLLESFIPSVNPLLINGGKLLGGGFIAAKVKNKAVQKVALGMAVDGVIGLAAPVVTSVTAAVTPGATIRGLEVGKYVQRKKSAVSTGSAQKQAVSVI